MKRLMCVMLCVSLGMVLCGTAIASPAIDSAVIKTRIWNDNPTSIVTTSNFYASSITIKDEQSVTAAVGPICTIFVYLPTAEALLLHLLTATPLHSPQM